jgi:DNA polymerase III epsilon subunit-like protein
MVVLGFRPKAQPAQVKVMEKESAETEKYHHQVSENEAPKQGPAAKFPSYNEDSAKKATAKAPPSKAVSKSTRSKHMTAKATSNWQKLKSLNTLKVSSLDATSNAIKNIFTSATSNTSKTYVSDEDWFGVSAESLQSAQAIKAVGMLKTNVTAISLFPPPPPNISKEKLAQASKFVALDCEMVGVGPRGGDSALARISVVNFHGQVLVDAYLKPLERVFDYRTAVSGIKPGHVTASHEGSEFNLFGQPLLTLRQAQDLVAPFLLNNRIVVGHSLKNDFKALMLSTGKKLCRDTSQYAPFRKLTDGKTPSLKTLAAHVLGVQIQDGAHDSVEDARIAMLLYRAVKKDWESRKFKD